MGLRKDARPYTRRAHVASANWFAGRDKASRALFRPLPSLCNAMLSLNSLKWDLAGT